MNKMNIIFGTDGWRGLIDKEVNEKTISIAAQAFADYLNSKFLEATVAIGFDGRKYSEEFATIFAEVLSGNNIKVFLSNSITPTPVLSYFVKASGLSAGVEITASHNPPEYNGIKFKAGYGGPFFTEETHKVEKLIGKSKIIRSEENIVRTDFLPIYLEQIESLIDFEAIRKSNINVLIDSMGGAGDKLIQNILEKYKIKCETIFGESDINFYGRLAEPIEKNLEPLKTKLSNENIYSMGLATDGDADRLGVLLENGEWLSAQETILLLSDYLINVKKLTGHIVKTSSVTNKLEHIFSSVGRNIFEVQVGFKYICEKMVEEDVVFGCEESGGYGYKKHIPERDGILSAFFLIEMLAKSPFKKLSEYLKEKRKIFGDIFYNRIDAKFESEKSLKVLSEIKDNSPSKFNNFEISDRKYFLNSRGVVNGLKFNLDNNTRWLLLRVSETEPLVRIYAEGQSKTEVQKLIEKGLEIFNDDHK
jgi:phosphomannomutase